MQFTNLVYIAALAGLFTTEVFALKSHCINYLCNGKNAHTPCTCAVQVIKGVGRGRHKEWIEDKGACGHKDLHCET